MHRVTHQVHVGEGVGVIIAGGDVAMPPPDHHLKQVRGEAPRHDEQGDTVSGELRERLGNLFGSVNSYEGRPSDSQIGRMEMLEAELNAKRAEFEKTAGRVDDLNRILAKRDLEPIVVLTEEEWNERQEGMGGSGAVAEMASFVLSNLF